jgi:hypothetical protein
MPKLWKLKKNNYKKKAQHPKGFQSPRKIITPSVYRFF